MIINKRDKYMYNVYMKWHSNTKWNNEMLKNGYKFIIIDYY